MLFLALLAIAALAVLPDLAFQVKRDREEEMIHRGVAYSRAIRRYFKKYGRYPTKLEDLENSNNLRFIRKLYKDPITNDDFALLRFGDPKLAGIMLGFPTQPTPGVNPQSPPIPNPTNPTQPTQPTPPPQPSTPTGDSGTGTAQTNPNPPAPSSTSSSSSGTSTPKVFGGGPIVGVISASTAQSIREFNKKNHYNDWLFIFSQTADRGGLPTGPYQPNLNSLIVPQVGPGNLPNPNLPKVANPPTLNPANPNQPPPMQ